VAARAKTPSRRKPAGKAVAAAPSASAEDRILDAALAVAARDGWRAASFARIAAAAEVELATLYALFPSKPALLAGLLRKIDRAVLAGGAPARGEGSPRDRLFDGVMRRFDALQPWRAGLLAIVNDGVDPLSGLALAGPFARSMAWMLEAAGIASGGLAGRMRAAGLAVVYARAFRAWLEDDSADLGKTMAALDRGLAQAERWASALPGVLSQGLAARPTGDD
jgi:AcrR family transcriptional regulator